MSNTEGENFYLHYLEQEVKHLGRLNKFIKSLGW